MYDPSIFPCFLHSLEVTISCKHEALGGRHAAAAYLTWGSTGRYLRWTVGIQVITGGLKSVKDQAGR